MKLSAKSFLTPGQVRLAAREWAAAGFGRGNTHVVEPLLRALNGMALSDRGSEDGVAVLVLGREDILAACPGLTDREVTDLLNRDWEPEMDRAKEEMLRAVADAVGKGT